MRLYTLPDDEVIDLDATIRMGKLFVNKNYPEYNSYEVYLSNGTSFGIFEEDLPRAAFKVTWETWGILEA
jgi:hypothetical protein